MPATSEVNARILYWGIAGAGKTTTLRTIHAKLRPDLRGELRSEPTMLDPTVCYEALPITLGEVGGVGTQIELIAVPGAADQAVTRKQLLDEVDGIVFVLDCAPEQIMQNFAAVDELKTALAAYGQRLDAFPLVLQYNKRDIADPFAIEDLHRRIGLDQAAVFETIATTGHGILATLTTIAKHVVRARRGATSASAAAPASSAAAVASAPPTPAPNAVDSGLGEPHDVLEAAILAEGEGEDLDDLADSVDLDLGSGIQPDWEAVAGEPAKPEAGLGSALRVVSAGQAVVEADGGVRLPLVLGDAEGRTRSVTLSLRLDEMVGDGGD